MRSQASRGPPAADRVDAVLECVRDVLGTTRRKDALLGSDSVLTEILDSFHLVQLVAALEERFGISFEQGDLFEPGNWVSPRTVSALVEKIKGRKD